MKEKIYNAASRFGDICPKKHKKSRQYGRLICPAASTTWPSTTGTAARFPAQPCPVPSLLFVCLPPSPSWNKICTEMIYRNNLFFLFKFKIYG